MDNYYVTTSIPYINGEPHIGHTYELLTADVLARYARQQGKKVILSTGTDEHGGKIQEKADELKKPIREYADEMSARWRDLGPLVNMSNDRFIRTTDPGHEQRAALIWKSLEKFIYKSKYSGWYCTGCEAFVTESVAKENKGICPIHNRPYERLEEENYFFKLTAFTKQISEAITGGSLRIIPNTRKNEILGIIKEGLEDVSISRPKDKISWGIPVPDSPTQVMYVWFEALMNYITVLGYPENQDFKDFWPADVQVIGKDISRFHALIWPGMLMGLGVALPKTLYIHGFINIDGQKISKSLGNVIHPREVVEKHGIDALRYYVLRHTPSYGDGDFTWEKFESAYNGELANELGNAVSRTEAMITKYQKGVIGDIPPSEHDSAQYHKYLDDCRFDRALEEVWEQIRGLNQYIDEQKPWVIAKSNDAEHLQQVLAYMCSDLLEISELLKPFLPDTSAKIKEIFETGVIKPSQSNLFPKTEQPRKS
ncbi:MAG TPA: methionine--tRNA ligase [Candidatus Saccharimonadales bacterium]|nr:methionine--tRNA ligase [Candidatus Saccharimonadales bacterium]